LIPFHAKVKLGKNTFSFFACASLLIVTGCASTALIVWVCAAAAQTNEFKMFLVTPGDKSFYEKIKKAVLTNDVEWLSEVISYPIELKQDGKNVTLNSSSDFKKYSASFLTPYLKSAVQSQSPDSLFKNWQGVMIGNGAVWFSSVKEEPNDDWKHRIIGINPEDRSIEKGKCYRFNWRHNFCRSAVVAFLGS